MSVQAAAQSVLARFTHLPPGQQSEPALVARVIGSGVQHLSKIEQAQALDLLEGVTSPNTLSALSADDRQELLAALKVVSDGQTQPSGALAYFAAHADFNDAQTASPGDIDRWTRAMSGLTHMKIPSMNNGSPHRALVAAMRASQRANDATQSIDNAALKSEIQAKCDEIVVAVAESLVGLVDKQLTSQRNRKPSSAWTSMQGILQLDFGVYRFDVNRFGQAKGNPFFTRLNSAATGDSEFAPAARAALNKLHAMPAKAGEAIWESTGPSTSLDERVEQLSFDRSKLDPVAAQGYLARAQGYADKGDEAFAFRMTQALSSFLRGLETAGGNVALQWDESSLQIARAAVSAMLDQTAAAGLEAHAKLMAPVAEQEPQTFLEELNRMRSFASKFDELITSTSTDGYLAALEGLELQAQTQVEHALAELRAQPDQLPVA